MQRIILTSFGLHTPLGYTLIAERLQEECLEKKRILLITLPEYEIDQKLLRACVKMGFEEKNAFIFKEDQRQEIEHISFDFIYISEGNTFELLTYIRQNGLIELIKKNVESGANYIGASAGAHIAGMDIEAAIPFDRNRLPVTDFHALGLFPGVVIPHYNPREIKRFLSYKEARDSGRYPKVYTVGDEEILVIS